MLADYIAFQKHKRLLTVELVNGGNQDYVIALNFSTGKYFEIISNVCAIEKTDNEYNKVQLLIDSVSLIMQEVDVNYNPDWVAKNISVKNQQDLLTRVIGAIDEIMGNDIFKIPNIQLNTKTRAVNKNDKAAQKRERERVQIEEMSKRLAQYKDGALMDDITIVMANTANSFNDVMQMPILAYRLLLKTICVNRLSENDEWKFEYLKSQTRDLTKKINSGEIASVDNAPTKKRGAQVSKLKQLL